MRSSAPSRCLPLALALVLSAGGCKLPNLRGPVPDSLAASRQLTQNALKSSQPQEAESLLAQAVKTCPADAEARRHYAETLWQRGNRPQAIAQLEEACRLCPENPAPRARLAEMRLASGQVEPARKTAEEAIALDPKSAVAWAVRGRAARLMGDPQQALADLHRALGYDPRNPETLFEVADLYRQLNQPQRALETLQSLAETYTSPAEAPPQVLYSLGLAYAAVQCYDDAAENLAVAASRGRPTPDMLYRLGEAQWLAGRPADASATLARALDLDPRHQPSRELLTRMELAQRTQMQR